MTARGLVGETFLAGDGNMPRVQSPTFGASERMVVAPGHEADGIVHMPGGQSGHPLSPFWGAGHGAWVRGEPTPFLPGTAVHALQLVHQPHCRLMRSVPQTISPRSPRRSR